MSLQNRTLPIRHRLLLLLLLVSVVRCVPQQAGSEGQGPAPEAAGPVVIRSVVGDYDQVWEDLVMALNDRGLVVSSVFHVGEMLERTGEALESKTRIFARANVMEFCSAVLSRQMMEENPHFIAFCPYQIKVYSLAGEENRVYLSYRRLLWEHDSGREVHKPVEQLLESLVSDVIAMQEEYR